MNELKKITLMRYFWIFTVVLFCNFSFSQGIENIKFRDTVYLYFKDGEEYNFMKSKTEENKFDFKYSYQFPDAKQLTFFTLPNEKQVKKNKNLIDVNKIFKIESINKLGYNNSLNLFFEKKLVVYLLEKKKCSKRKVLLKRVYLGNIKDVIM